MRENTRTTHTTSRRRDDRRLGPPSEPATQIGEMTCLVLITVAAALLAGVLALPFTMPGGVFADSPKALGAADSSPSATIHPT